MGKGSANRFHNSERSSKKRCAEDEEEEEVNSNDLIRSATKDLDRSISVTLSDPDVLDCSYCYEPLSIPVFQCENGHISCSICCSKIGYNCGMCLMPIGFKRCRAIEKVLESIKISCKNAKYGCKETLSYCNKNDHERKCIHVQCSCPLSGCDFVASSKELSIHLSHEHGDSSIQFLYNNSFSVSLKSDEDEVIILQEETDDKLFILNHNVMLLGNVVNISCIGPNSYHHYDIIAKSSGCSLKLEAATKNVQEGIFDAYLSSEFLMIPSNYFGSSIYPLKLQISIRRIDSATHSACP